MVEFEWDSTKAASNRKKHDVSFEEAKSVFYDEFAVQFYDPDSSELEEDRFLMLGLSCESRILLLCHCERDSGNTIRMISARKATKKERKFYEGDE
ncbi:MAG: BrnT family toxin [Gammaproteobacteria bacterium]|nr:BrnT family toxin [Gammaproteobacteria bacterium]MBQ0839676.1 BrnT family toxin [Gammaproteobacteria bacterium]